MLDLSFAFKLVSRCAYALVLAPLLCFAYSDKVYHSIQEAWVYDRHGDYHRAIEICNFELEDTTVTQVDRMHLLIARSLFYVMVDDQEGYLEDQKAILEIRKSCQECETEFRMYYD